MLDNHLSMIQTSLQTQAPEVYKMLDNHFFIHTRTHTCMCHYRVPGEIKSREVELDPQPRRGHEQGGGAGLQKLDFFCFGFLCDSAQARQLKQQLCSAQVTGQWRGDTAITLPLFWRRSTVSPVFLGRYPQSSLHSLVPFPPCPCP